MKEAVVFQSDFGLYDGAVSAMYGVAHSVCQDLRLFDLTHEIPTYHIWEASYRLVQTVHYWKPGTVFVSVVDPGVGTQRKSVVAKTKMGHFIVTPDNGTLTHLNREIGIDSIREIDETKNRLPRSGASYTFHGRDVYAYTAARLASNTITFEEVGPELSISHIVKLPVVEASYNDQSIEGTIDILDNRFGNIWTNISRSLFENMGTTYGDLIEITISYKQTEMYRENLRFCRTFSEVDRGHSLLYVNSLDYIAIAMNQGSFALQNQINTGTDWQIKCRKLPII